MDPRARRILFNIVPTVLVLGIMYLSVFGGQGLVRRHHMREELARVNRQLAATEESNAVLRRDIQRLQVDDQSRARAAAEELLLVPPGSTVYRFAP